MGRMNIRIPIATVALAISFAGASLAQEAASAPAGDAAAGQTLFHAIGCWECHGTQGQGGAISGPKIGGTALPFDAFLQQLRTPQNQMPPYEPEIVSNADAANIYAFLKSIPPAQTASDIPALKGLN
jgi:mono/diheme cytochrome c family protein